jgi:hypothetical protein
MAEQLYIVLLPQFEDEYKKLDPKLSLTEYLLLRKCELVANEIRFPGYSKLLLKKAQCFAKMLFGSLIANVGLLMFLGFKHKSHCGVVVQVK